MLRKTGAAPLMNTDSSHPIVLYDGVCGLCNRLNQFLLKRDKHDRFRFASLQSEFSRELLARYGRNPTDLDTVYIVLNHGRSTEQLLMRSDAIIAALSVLGGVWQIAGIGKILPRFVRDRIYNFVAANRYRVFGKSDTCMLPPASDRAKFIDV